MNQIRLIFVLLVNLSAARDAFANTTALTFDEFTDGTIITTQYQSLGVIISGATATLASNTQWPANTPLNIAYSPTGLMTFTLNPSVIGNIQSVSAYLSGTNIGIYGFDASGNLVGQAVAPSNSTNVLTTISSSGNPIVQVQIHDGGGSFAVDTVSFVSGVSTPGCSDVTTQLTSAVNALAKTEFKEKEDSREERVSILRAISGFDTLRTRKAPDSALYNQLNKIREKIIDDVRITHWQRLLNLIDQLIIMTKANQCA